jgi:hypothetical protein
MTENRYDMSGIEIIAVIATIVMMRGCYHCGVIAEKVSPETYKSEKPYENNPTANGAWINGYGLPPNAQ